MSSTLKFIITVTFLILIIIISLFIGSQTIPVHAIVVSVMEKVTGIDFGQGLTPVQEIIIFDLRLPRIILAMLVGASLGLAGLIYQVLLRNPLAEPFTLGISSGASFGVAMAIFIGSTYGIVLPLLPFTMIGGLVSIVIIFLFSLQKQVSLFTIIFVGICISFFFNAILTLLLSLLGNRSYEVLIWMFGTFQRPLSLSVLLIPAGALGLVTVLTLLKSSQLDAFYFSEEITASMGVAVIRVRALLFVSVSLLAVLSVSYCGIIGFVGLIVPHLVRLLFGHRHKLLIPAVLISGAALTVLSDTIARSLVSLATGFGKELPVGVVTALLGSPFFLYLLIQYRHRMLEH